MKPTVYQVLQTCAEELSKHIGVPYEKCVSGPVGTAASSPRAVPNRAIPIARLTTKRQESGAITADVNWLRNPKCSEIGHRLYVEPVEHLILLQRVKDVLLAEYDTRKHTPERVVQLLADIDTVLSRG